MDPDLIAVAARSLERVIAVLLGGLSIYYGFRLFLVVPTETHADGQIRLPGISVVLTKAGPGVFFAAFGALVIITSLLQAVTVEGQYVGMVAAAAPEAKPGPSSRNVDAQDVARAKLAIQTLNCLRHTFARASATAIASDSDLAIREAKLALMNDVWDSPSWGDRSAFAKWAASQTGSAPGAAKAVFDGERSDCPLPE